MYKIRATKVDVLKLISKRKVIVSYDLMHAFGYSHTEALHKLERLRKRYLIQAERSPDGKVKSWSLTDIGRKTLVYLIDKTDGLEGGVTHDYR